MNDGIARVSHLIQQLLDLARLEGDQACGAEPADAAQMLRQMLAQAASAAIAGGVELSLHAPDSLPLRLDSHAFRGVAQNLLENAIRYTTIGNRISVELSRMDDTLTLAVADDGPGIAPEFREKVFERFYRGANHDIAGAGLGLSIVRQAVSRMGGTVQLTEGIEGKGCRFTVCFPVQG